MRKVYKTFALILIFIFLTTYSPTNFKDISTKENYIFKIQNIEILNIKIVNEKEIINKLSHIYKKNIFFIKKEDLESPLKSIDFIEKIEVKKKYPNSIVVKIYETKPVAILFKKNNKYILDSSSNLINFTKVNFDKEFPSVFGENAEKEFVTFYNHLINNNFPITKVKSYYFFQIGRWDLQLLEGQLVKLPNTELNNAIQKSIKIMNDKNFENYKVIDLRINGKIVVQ